MKEYLARSIAGCVFLWMAALPDLRSQKIPVWIPGSFLAAAVTADLLWPVRDAQWELWAGALPGAVLLSLSFLLKGNLGEGDGICLAVYGLFTGIAAAVMAAEAALVLAALTGGFRLWTGRWKAGDRFAFLPFLAAAGSLILLAGVSRAL